MTGETHKPQSTTKAAANASHPHASEDHGQEHHDHGQDHHDHHGHGLSHVHTDPLADVGTILSFKADLAPNIHHQPKVAEHRGEQQRARNHASVLHVLGEDEHKRSLFDKGLSQLQIGKSMQMSTTQLRRTTVDSHDRKSMHTQSIISLNKMGGARDDRSSGGSGHSSKGESDKNNEDDAWDIFLDELPADDDDLVERSPLYEMANVDIEVEESLTRMEEALRISLEQGRVSDRERTVLLDKFGLFLQSLVSFQENEVELIDHIGMKSQILEVLVGFAAEDYKNTELMISQQTGRVELSDEDVLDFSSSKLADEGGATREEGGVEPPGLAIDEMNATAIRESLLLQKNKLEMQEQMKMIHLLELKQLEFEKTLLTLHYSKMIKPSDLQKEMRDHRKVITDIKIEIGTLHQEITQIQLDISAEEKSLRDDEAHTNQLDLDTLSKQIEVTQNSSKPLHLAKDADREAHKLEQLQDTLTNLEERWMTGMAKYRVYQTKIEQKNAEYTTLLKEEARMNQAKKLAQLETDRVLIDIEVLQKKEQGLLNKARVTIEKITYNVKLKRKLYEQHHVIYNETTRAQREYLKLERTIKMARESLLNAKLAHEKMRTAFDTIQPKGDSDNWEKLRKMFSHEIETLKGALEKRIAEGEISSATVESLQKKLSELYEEQVQCGKELQTLMRTTVRKRRERQDKAEQCIKLEAQLYGLVTEIRMKKLILDDCGRNERDLNRSLTLIQKQYAQVKIEKASLVSDLIQARQRVTEQSEKFKIANNELESYINQSLDRQREITRIHYLLLNAGLARDSVRNDALRAVQKFRFHRIERDELKMSNGNTRKEISRLRKDVTEIRIRFEGAIEGSSAVALSLRERTEEVCTFIERIIAYEMILLRGTEELRLRELEKSKLLSTLNEVKTHLLIVTAKEPDENKFVEKVENLRLDLYAVTKERRALENELSNLTYPGRVRELHHNWIEEREQVPHLRKKINTLECLLATREVRILERGLTLKQVDDLTEGSMEKASHLKQKYECEVKVLVGMRKTLYHLSTRIDGMICETSLALARADAAEIEYMREKKELVVAESRFNAGFPPSRQIQLLWNRKIWQDEMIRRSRRSSGHGFLVKKSHPTGAGVVMERLRPRSKSRTFVYDSPPSPVVTDFPSARRSCPKFPYKPRHRKLSCTKPHLSGLPTGLRFCH